MERRDLTDVVVVGGGFAGSLLALTLARQGVSVKVVDLRRVYPPDFRCEKLGLEQARWLAELGALAPIAMRAGFGPVTAEVMARRGLPYQDMVNGLREAWPETVGFHEGRVSALRTSEDWQIVELSTGERLFARLVVLATGRNERLRRSIGVERRTLRERHSLCIGFSFTPGEGRHIRSQVLHGAHAGDGIGFVSLFPMNGAMRANLFCYRDPESDWAKGFRIDPLAALAATFPRLGKALAGARALGPAELGVIDLYETRRHLQDGVVLIGDAFCSSCPATAMGLTRVLADVRQLGLAHIPAWLATPGMGAGKIFAFYADPVKQATDRRSRRRAEIGRLEATARGPAGHALRLVRRIRRAMDAAA